MSDLPTLKRQLTIKTGATQRLIKEHLFYEKEAVQQKQKVDKLEADAGEEWDLKNGRRMLEESNKMITDSSERLGKAVAELKDLILAAEKEPGLAEAEEFLKAKEALQEAST